MIVAQTKWPTRKLAECGRWVSGGTPSKAVASYWNGDIPWISSKSLKSFDLSDSEDRITQAAVDNGTTLVPTGTVMFVVRGMSLANEFRVGVTTRPVAFNQDLRAILPTSDIDGRYLTHYLRATQQVIMGLANNASHGTKRLPTEMIESVSVPVPPLPEQRRIAAILDKANAIRRKREEGIRLTEELLRSTFLEMFGDPAKQSLWEEKSLGEVIEIASGQVDPKEQPYASMPHVGGDNIESQTGEIKGAATAEELGLISGKYEFTPQDVLYSKIRPALNKVACPDFHGICSADIYPIRPNTGKIGREYLASLLRSEDFLLFATKHSSRTNIPKINRPALLSYKLKLPLFNDQLRFEAAAKRIREMKCHRTTACDVAEALVGSLVQRAFRGEL